MYLEKIEIQGFKSFASKTTVILDRGTTAVVGPNGSGKSNVADAIRWVMGEQSMKTLRGKKAEDIIFAGTHKKARLGMAEVSLYLNNEDGQMPVDYSQVVITRRLYRDGNGEYLLNKSKVRLLDIQELLAKSGFGQKTYSVIGQGMIDAILRASPKERQEMFEEAAGVKHFQIKKNSSVNKLERTKDNLDRAGDLLAEITPRRNSLKRQANKAEKKEQIQQELSGLQERYFNHQWNQNKKSLSVVMEGIEKYIGQEKKIEKEIVDTEEAIKQAEKNIDYRQEDEQREKLDELNYKNNKIKEQLAVVRGRIEVEEERDAAVDVRSLRQRQEEVKGGLESYKKRLESSQREKEKAATEQEKMQGETENINQRITGLRTRLQEEQARVSQAKNQGAKEKLQTIYKRQGSFLNDLRDCKTLKDLMSLREIASKLHEEFREALDFSFGGKKENIEDVDQVNKIQQQIDSLLADKEKIERELHQHTVDIAVKDTEIKTAQEQLEKDQQELVDLEKKIADATAGTDRESGELIKLQGERDKLEKELAELDKIVADINHKLQQEREQKKEQRQKLFDLEQQYRTKQEELNNTRQQKNNTEIKRAKIENEKELLLDEIRDNTKSDEYTELLAKFDKSPRAIEREKANELGDKIKKLRQQLIKIGEIDPAVVDEYKECNERFEFLTDQRADLEGAIKSLDKIIAELDETIKKKFNVAFKNINQHFQKYFTVLFGGGKAKLVKTKVAKRKAKIEEEDESDVPEDGSKEQIEEIIDIKATPPGKKLQELSMLSGGERALTSIALLFAIITNSPAPFMMLDEVDAALDESNTGRYADIVASLAKKSQFIIITHNRETMRRSDLLYGVTMEESGVSKLLSVKLDNLE